MRKTTHTIFRRRIAVVLVFFFAAIAILIGRLFLLQIVYHKEYQTLAARQHKSIETDLPERGSIFALDKTGALVPLAFNKLEKNLIAAPKFIQDAGETAGFLAELLNLDANPLREKLSNKTDTYEIIAKNINPETAKKIEERKITGLSLDEEKRRAYPHSSLAAQLLGFTSIEEQNEEGRYGLERFYNSDLSGDKGFLEGTDRGNFLVSLGRKIFNPQQNGADIILTIDYNIQLKTEEVLAAAMKKWDAVSGNAIVLEPKTGKILALAGSPSFDPNEFSKVKDYSLFLNQAVEANFELGSVMKPVTMSAALEEHVVKPETTYDDTGEVKMSGFTIRNFDLRAHGVQTMRQVIEKSLNTGMVFVSKLLGHEKQLQYFKQFGFGEKTGIDLPGEVTGNISNLSTGKDIDFATASFGQGIAVTPIQAAVAIGAIANQGKLVKPYVVDRIVDDSGNTISYGSEFRRDVISKETAETMTKVLVSTVRNSFENKAGVKHYFVAGKTGTAQIPKKDGRGYSDEVIHTFVGFAPAFNPRFLALIQLNKPKGNRFAANTLTPPFHDLAEYILNYYEIPPDEK